MKRFVLGLGCALAMLPGVASAAISLNPAPQTINVTPGAVPTGEQTFDYVFNDTTGVNEGLFAYDLYVLRDKPGLTLVRADKPAVADWVMREPDATFINNPPNGQPGGENTPVNGLLVNVFGSFNPTTPLDDITTGLKAARIVYTLDPNIAPGDYRVFLDTSPQTTNFTSGDPNYPDPNNPDANIPVNVSQAFIVHVTPEPASLSLFGFAGLLALRRRRTA